MNPVFAVVVSDTAIKRVRREYKDEMARVAYAAEQVVVKLACTQFFYVQEHGHTSQLQVNFQ